MKINKILSICLSMALLSSGCSDDLGLQPDNNPVAGEGQTVRIAASMGNQGSRLAYNETDTEVTLAWEEGDVLKVLNPTRDAQITPFTLVEGEGTIAGQFEGKPVNAYQKGDKLYALYHNTLADSEFDEDGNVTITLKEQNGQLNPDYQIMYGDAVYKGDGAIPGMKLNNLVSILKLSIPSDKPLTKVVLNKNQFRTKATLVLQNSPSDAHLHNFQSGELVYSDDKFGNDGYGDIVAEGLFEPKDGIVVVYFYVLPSKRYWIDEDWFDELYPSPSFKAYAKDGKELFCATRFDRKVIENGRMYELHPSVYSIVDFANEAEADGSKDNPYLIANHDQLYSFMLRCNDGKQNKDGNSYHCLHYKLDANIQLDGSAIWEAPHFYGTFDGQGYTISGIMHDAFFNNLSGAEVSNLVLDFEYDLLDPERNTYYNFGALALSAHDSNILNCVNRTSIYTAAYHLAGLVAEMDNTKMIGCVNHGDLENINEWECLKVGGLVADMSGESLVEACFNTGDIIIENANVNVEQCFGGLVAHIDSYGENLESDAIVNSCWASGLIIYSNWSEYWHVGNLVGWGNVYNSDWVENSPTSDQLKAMNQSITNTYFEFDTATGGIVAKKPAVSLPEFDIEDF